MQELKKSRTNSKTRHTTFMNKSDTVPRPHKQKFLSKLETFIKTKKDNIKLKLFGLLSNVQSATNYSYWNRTIKLKIFDYIFTIMVVALVFATIFNANILIKSIGIVALWELFIMFISDIRKVLR